MRVTFKWILLSKSFLLYERLLILSLMLLIAVRETLCCRRYFFFFSSSVATAQPSFPIRHSRIRVPSRSVLPRRALYLIKAENFYTCNIRVFFFFFAVAPASQQLMRFMADLASFVIALDFCCQTSGLFVLCLLLYLEIELAKL